VFRRLSLVTLFVSAAGNLGAEELADPMRPPDSQDAPNSAEAPVAPRPALTLQSTLVSGDRRSAVINGRSVGVGERVNGARVVAISASGVRLRDGRGVFTLRLPSAGGLQRVDRD